MHTQHLYIPATPLPLTALAVSLARGRHPLEWTQRIPGNRHANSPLPALVPRDLKQKKYDMVHVKIIAVITE